MEMKRGSYRPPKMKKAKAPKSPVPHARIRAALRKIWLWSPERREALKLAKGTGLNWWRCQGCGQFTHNPQVDHITPCGATPGSKDGMHRKWDCFIPALFCPVEGLQVLCKFCHDEKTYGPKA